jgi:hypothetical protein
VAGIPLEEIFANPRWGEMSLRWALIDMIGEYAGAQRAGRPDQGADRREGQLVVTMAAFRTRTRSGGGYQQFLSG